MRYLAEAAARNFNLSEVARAVHTSQPVISRQIQLLEEELGFDVLLRRGKRIIGLSREGKTVLAAARRMLQEADDLKRFAQDRSSSGRERLTVATTHFHARYTLLAPILQFQRLHPHVLLRLKQSDPVEIERLVNAEEVDMGITAQSPSAHTEIVSIPWQSVPKIVITKAAHPLLSPGPLTLERLAAFPLIVYDEKYSGGWSVMRTFHTAGLQPNVIMTAMDADVIKAYVAAGLGVSVVQSAVYDPALDAGLCAIDASELFEPLLIVMMLTPRLYLNQAVLDFAATVMPELDASEIRLAVRGQQEQLSHSKQNT